MAIPVLIHEISEYSVSFFDGPIDPQTGSRARISLFANGANVATLKFRDQGQSLPEPTFADTPTASYPLSVFASLLDVLRNEKPVFVRINQGAVVDPDERAEAITVVTTREPIGESEVAAGHD